MVSSGVSNSGSQTRPPIPPFEILLRKDSFCESLPYLIDDLETFYEERGPEPGLQRVLGDAYARNGQLQKALRVYREALDSL